MKKIASCSAVALGLALVTGAGFADTVKTGATTMSSNPQSSTYTLLPYITVSTSPYISSKLLIMPPIFGLSNPP